MKLIQKLKAKLLTKLFIDWVNDEWDLQMLEMTKSLIVSRETFLKTLLHISKRKTIVGFGGNVNANN